MSEAMQYLLLGQVILLKLILSRLHHALLLSLHTPSTTDPLNRPAILLLTLLLIFLQSPPLLVLCLAAPWRYGGETRGQQCCRSNFRVQYLKATCQVS